MSFARSHTLTSFDEMSFGRSSRLSATKSQERLIGGKKATNSPELLQHHQLHHHLHHTHQHQQLHDKQRFQIAAANIPLIQPEIINIEKLKKSVMKAQATQTDIFLARKLSMSSHLSLSPRTVHRVSIKCQFKLNFSMEINRATTNKSCFFVCRFV